MKIEIIRDLIRSSGMTNREIAAACHISATTLYNALAGMDVKISTVEALAHVLGVPVGYLFGEGEKVAERPGKAARKVRFSVELEMTPEELKRSGLTKIALKHLQKE